MYVVTRRLDLGHRTEYSDRFYGEALAMKLVMPRKIQTDVVLCEHRDVCMRNNVIYVVDRRWRSMSTMEQAMAAAPSAKNVKAIVWSNTVRDAHVTEQKVLSWLLGAVNNPPDEATVDGPRRRPATGSRQRLRV